MALADQDESVRIAVRALGDMRNSTQHNSPSTSFQTTPTLSVTSAMSSPSLPSPSLIEEDLREDEMEDRRRLAPTSPSASEDAGAQRDGEEWKTLSRVQNIPLVNSALRAYEQSKASSRVVKADGRWMVVGAMGIYLQYGAEMMESSMKTISRPVIDRLPVGQLDEFASRQLDRLGSYTRGSSSRGRSRGDSVDSPDRRRPWESRDGSMTRSPSRETWSREDDTRSREATIIHSPLSAVAESRTPTPHSSSSSQPERPILPPASTLTQHADAQESQQVAQRSRWQTVFLEAGGISAALSEESMRRLKYCLQWLQYATAQIDAQILVLRNFIASLQPHGTSPHDTPISAQHLRTLQMAKRDVVDTIRQVVEVMSRYAGGALPEPARSRVRSFILCLPRRWATASGVGVDGPVSDRPGHSYDARGESTATSSTSSARQRHRGTAPYSYGPGEAGPSPRSRPASRAPSPVRGPSRGHSRQTSAAASGATPPTVDGATQAAQKILTLAMESLDMLRGVTGVFKDSLDRADIWVERLRVVGVQRGQNGNVEGDADGEIINYRDTHLPPFLPREHRGAHSPSSPLSPYAPLSPATPGSGYSTPFYSIPRSSSTGSLSGLAFPGPLSMAPPYDAPSPAGHAATVLDKLSLSSNHSEAGSRLATPKSALMGLPPEGDSGGGGRGEKRRNESDDGDRAVAAATALAGMAGSGGLSAKRIKQEEREVGMEVD
ncbi:Opi1-domain-containing protein [Dichomitus squalens]|uniref:Opi1-domain-containing protein n=1 Tax=Dichomitus squalens TaxID=114155 RepID=A0A4Q9MAJ5_9APHY|nr:Opi1-domain-containing protein [Dichomitus squalens]